MERTGHRSTDGVRAYKRSCPEQSEQVSKMLNREKWFGDHSETDDVSDAVEQSVTRPSSTEPTSKLTRAPSMPELYGNFLLCDWMLLTRTPYHIAHPSSHQCREDRHRALRTARRASIGSNTAHDGMKWTSEPPKVKTKLGDYTREDLNSDLHHLSEVEPAFVHSVAQDDIHPLLQAAEHGLSDRQKSRLAAHDQERRRKREDEERRREEEERNRREAEALPTLEDMEKMQYFRSRAPQSLSRSHASLHVRSNASDCQSTSQHPSSHLDLHSMGERSVVVDQWSEGGGAPSLSGSLLSSAGGGVSELSLSQSGPVERQSLHRLPTDDGGESHIASLHSHHSSLHYAASGVATGPMSHHGSISHLDMTHASGHGSVKSDKTASQHGPVSSCLSISQHRSVSSQPDMKTTSVLQHGSLGSQLEMETTPRLGGTSDVDTASWRGSSSSLETASHPGSARTSITAPRHAGSADNGSQYQSAGYMEPAFQRPPSMDSSSCGGSSISTLIPSQHGSASSIDSTLFQNTASKMEHPSQTRPTSNMDVQSPGGSSSNASSRLISASSNGTVSQHGSGRSNNTVSRHGSATSSNSTVSRYGSATASKMETTASPYTPAGYTNPSSNSGSVSSTPSQSRSASSIDSASFRGSAIRMETGSPSMSSANMMDTVTHSGSVRSTETHSLHGSTGNISQSTSAIMFSCGGSASNILIHSRHGSPSTADTTSQHGSTFTSGKTSQHGSANKLETVSQHASASNVDGSSASRPGSASTLGSDSRRESASAGNTVSQRGSSASTIRTVLQKGSASTRDIDSQKGSTSSASQHGSVSEIEAGSQSVSAMEPLSHSQEGSTMHLGTALQHETSSRMEYSSVSHESASSHGGTWCTPSQLGLASTVDIASQHGSATAASRSTSASNMDGSASNTPVSSRPRSVDTTSWRGSRHGSSRERESVVRSPAASNVGFSSHTASASNIETISQHESARNTPSRHGSISTDNIETTSQSRPICNSLNEDIVSRQGTVTSHPRLPDTPLSMGSGISTPSHHSTVSSATRATHNPLPQEARSSQTLGRRPETLHPQPSAQDTSNTSTTSQIQQQLLQSSKLSLTSRLSGGNTLPAVESVVTAGASTGSGSRMVDGGGEEVVGGGVSLPGSRGMMGDGGSLGGEDTSCEGGDSSAGWENGALGDGQSFSDVKSFAGTSFSDLGSQEEERETSEKEPENQGHQPQPAVITSIINDQVVRSSDMCVSERAPLTTLRLKPYKPIWNELTGELDRKTVDEMDSNLTEGQEMEILYHELIKTIPQNYLDMESEPSLVPALPESVDLSRVLASSSLPHRASRRVANPDLRPVSTLEPPWGDKTKRDQWKNSNLYTGPDPKELMAPKGSTLTPAQARQRQQYQNWLKWWRSTISCDDYLKFVAQKETDYLHHLYHLYDSEGSESEGEEERERRERLVRLHSTLQAKHARREERYRKKTQYEQGMWNINTIMMGGLGGDPHSSGSSSEEELEDQLWKLEQKTEGPQKSVQERFRAVWSRLHLSQEQTMDMAAKYSTHKHQQHIRKALSLWERACTVIEEREGKLEDLLTFEKCASNPSRLFAKGRDGSSESRLHEAKRRKQIHSVLDELEQKLSQLLRKLQSRYGDIVTYKGRPYREKMQHDQTELLYLLQQERRRAQLPPSPPGSPTATATTAITSTATATEPILTHIKYIN